MVKEKESEVYNFMDNLEMDKVDKVSELNILPTLKVSYDKINKISDVFNVKVHSLPTPTKFADGNTYDTMLLEMNDVIYQFNANGKSFQFQLGVLITKHFEGKLEKLIGHIIQISKTMAKIDTPNFKGVAEVYIVSLIK